MEHVLLGVVPLGLAAAVSPVMLTEQTVLMAGRGGRPRSWAYAVGALLVATAYVAALVTLGRSVPLPTLPRVDGATDVLIGLVLPRRGCCAPSRVRSVTTPAGSPSSCARPRERTWCCADSSAWSQAEGAAWSGGGTAGTGPGPARR